MAKTVSQTRALLDRLERLVRIHEKVKRKSPHLDWWAIEQSWGKTPKDGLAQDIERTKQMIEEVANDHRD